MPPRGGANSSCWEDQGGFERFQLRGEGVAASWSVVDVLLGGREVEI